jgi:hypothetical protein
LGTEDEGQVEAAQQFAAGLQVELTADQKQAHQEQGVEDRADPEEQQRRPPLQGEQPGDGEQEQGLQQEEDQHGSHDDAAGLQVAPAGGGRGGSPLLRPGQQGAHVPVQRAEGQRNRDRQDPPGGRRQQAGGQPGQPNAQKQGQHQAGAGALGYGLYLALEPGRGVHVPDHGQRADHRVHQELPAQEQDEIGQRHQAAQPEAQVHAQEVGEVGQRVQPLAQQADCLVPAGQVPVQQVRGPAGEHHRAAGQRSPGTGQPEQEEEGRPHRDAGYGQQVGQMAGGGVHVREIVGFPHGLVNYLQVWRRGALGACLFSPDSLCFNC